MSNLHKKFLQNSQLNSNNKPRIEKIKYNISKYYQALNKGRLKYTNFEQARNKASSIKSNVINNLGCYLEKFCINFKNNGGDIFFADNSTEAVTNIYEIIKKYNANYVVKSKSMTTEEIDLNFFLEKKGIKVLESDLGEFIVQLDNEKPFHIVTPAMHKSLQDVINLYNKKFNTPKNYNANQITEFTRKYFRKYFKNSVVGITGANFLLSENGAITLTENEGNGLLASNFPKVQIIISGFEKLLPSINDLSFFWQFLSYNGTGQSLTAYNSIIFGPKTANENEGPEKVYLILLDNNRSNILSKSEYKEILKCIKCGACLNYCPIYKIIGGHNYNSAYSGPVGSVLSPLLFGINYSHLAFACTLCKKCEEVCPVKIPITHSLLYLRRKSVKNSNKIFENFMFKNAQKFLLSRKRFNLNKNIKNLSLRIISPYFFGKKRHLPCLSKTFSSQNSKK